MNFDLKLLESGSGLDPCSLLDKIIKYLKKDDPLFPITVVGPSTYANLSLRQALGRVGFANVQFMPLARVSELLGASKLASQGHRPLTPMLENAAIRAACSEAQGILKEVRNHPATQTALKATFKELRYLSTDVLERISAQNEMGSAVVELYQKFKLNTSEFYDHEELARSATVAVTTGDANGLADLGFILFYYVRRFTVAERELVEALGKQQKAAAVILGLTGDDEADAPIKGFFGGFGETLEGYVRSLEPPTGTDTRLVITPDPQQEVRWIIRSIMQKAESGIPFRRMGIVYRNSRPYGRLVKEELEMAGLPVAGPSPDTFADSAAGRVLIGLMDLAGQDDISRDTVMDWLNSCPVRPREVARRDYSPSLWDVVSRKAGVVRGLDQWSERLTKFAASTKQSAVRANILGDITDEQSARMLSESEAAGQVLKFVQDLAGYIMPPPDGSSWGDFARWATDLLDRYLVAEAELSDAELTSLLKIKGKLNEMVSIEDLQPRPTQRIFREALNELLQAGIGHVGTTGKGVFIGPFSAASTMSFDTVYLVGMVEGAVPPRIADDPLLPDRNRREAEGDSPEMTLREVKRADERYEYLSALATAPNRVLSFPNADSGSQRISYPSRWFLAQASSLAGKPVYTSTINSLTDRPWLTVIPSFEGSIITDEQQSLANLHDYRLERLWNWKQAGLWPEDHPLAQSGTLRKAFDLRRGKNMAQMTDWDGDVSALSSNSIRLDPVNASIHSPTSLERWAKCPFSYYLSNVLRLSAVDRPEEIQSITPLDKGILIHDVLETFFSGVLQEGSVPDPKQDWTEGHLESLRNIAEQAFVEAQVTGRTGKRLLWEMEKAIIMADLEAFLLEDSRFRERFNVTPQGFEARFGFGADSWKEVEVELSDKRMVKFKGMIDRIDVDEASQRVLVTDYKTGGITRYSGMNRDPLDGGMNLQLPVYALAVKQNMADDLSVRAAYWFVTSRGRFSLRPSSPLEIDEVLDRFREVIAVITDGIGSGIFPANPGPRRYIGGFQNCSSCAFDRICPARRDVVWERKKFDPRLTDYLDIIESRTPAN